MTIYTPYAVRLGHSALSDDALLLPDPDASARPASFLVYRASFPVPASSARITMASSPSPSIDAKTSSRGEENIPVLGHAKEQCSPVTVLSSSVPHDAAICTFPCTTRKPFSYELFGRTQSISQPFRRLLDVVCTSTLCGAKQTLEQKVFTTLSAYSETPYRTLHSFSLTSQSLILRPSQSHWISNMKLFAHDLFPAPHWLASPCQHHLLANLGPLPL